MSKIIKKSDINNFILSLKKKATLYAPVKTDMVRFQEITTKEEINLIDFKGHAFFPPKKYLLPNQEELLAIRNNKIKSEKIVCKPQIVFGARLCDLNAIRILDKLFLDPEHPDKYYESKRESTTFIGLNCEKEIDEFCFCSSMDLQHNYDLLLTDKGEHYSIEVRTNKGMNLVKSLPDNPDSTTTPLPKTSKVLNPKDLYPFFVDKWWEGMSEECVGCQRCTTLCPTCFCFDVKDEMSLNLKDGARLRVIDSCHSPDFTRVAGDHIFRKRLLQRYRHRVMHKLQYYKDEFKTTMCTGCGRCIRYCHSKIDFVKTINEDFDHEKNNK